LIKLVDTAVPPAPPSITISFPSSAEAGKPVRMSASADVNGVPALNYRWQFGDGTSAAGAEVTHTYTLAGTYSIRLSAEGNDGIPAGGAASLHVTGVVDVYTDQSESDVRTALDLTLRTCPVGVLFRDAGINMKWTLNVKKS
jgi:PKD repeat protein